MSDPRHEPPRVSVPQTFPEILHLGCGKKKYPGSYGVDRSRLAAADQSLYEKRFMYWYPVQTIFFQLEVIK